MPCYNRKVPENKKYTIAIINGSLGGRIGTSKNALAVQAGADVATARIADVGG